MKKAISIGILFVPLLFFGQSKFNQFKAQKFVLEGVKNYYKEDYSSAVRSFNKAVDLNPTNRDVYVFRADAFYQLDQYELALHDYEAALQVQGESAEIYYRRGMTFERLGLYREAVRDYDFALEQEPNFVKAQRRKSRIRKRQNDPTSSGSDDWGYADTDEDASDPSWWEGTSEPVEEDPGIPGFEDPETRDVIRNVRVFELDNLFIRKSPKDMTIQRVELAEYTTRILVEYSNVSNTYQQLYLDPPSTRKALYLTDMRLQKKYHLTNIYRDEGTSGNFRNNVIAPGEKMSFYLEFERIPDDLEVFQIRTGDRANTEKWNFYGVILKK
ncbi:MAG: tetratricopeptide repeat protein [Bacteroidota bacterium]